MKKTIIITGASDGLGKAMAYALRDNNLILIARNEEKLKQISEELGCEYLVCDLRNVDEIKKLTDKIKKVDVLINNAGLWLADDLEDNGFEAISDCIDVNTKAPILLTKTVLPIMREQKSGLIINVCSQASFNTDEFSPVYNATKWAMRGFNRSLINVFNKDGISITGFYPGFMQTDLFKKAGNDYDTQTGMPIEKVANVVKFIVELDPELVVPEFGLKDMKNV